jgi:hypothetical protein
MQNLKHSASRHRSSSLRTRIRRTLRLWPFRLHVPPIPAAPFAWVLSKLFKVGSALTNPAPCAMLILMEAQIWLTMDAGFLMTMGNLVSGLKG